MNYRVATAGLMTLLVAASGAWAATPDDSAMAGYFGNSAVLRRNSDGRLHVIIYYQPDHTFKVWDEGVWKKDGTWLINSLQDSSIMCLTEDLGSKPFTMCHTFRAGRKVGDHWAASEPANIAGGVAYPGSPSMKTSTVNSTSIEAGLVAPPNPFVPLPPQPSVLPSVAPDDQAMVGYFGNSLVMRDRNRQIVEIIHYRKDRTYRKWVAGTWRDGAWAPAHWSEGTWVTNNGQDHSILCISETLDGHTLGACHYMTPDRKIGSHWETASAKPGVASGLVSSIEKGLVQPRT